MKRTHPRPLALLIITLVLLSAVAYKLPPADASTEWRGKIDAEVVDATERGAAAEFIVVLREQADLTGVERFGDKTERGRHVYETMTAVARQTQAPLRALLDARGASYRAYWITNMIWVRGGRELAVELASRADVQHLYANPVTQLDRPVQTVVLPPAARDGEAIEWNIAKVNAPAAWAAGYTGQGVVIGGQDTGYNWEHPALKAGYRGWDGATASHDYNWHDAIHEDFPTNGPGNPCGIEAAAPCDDQGHGTHTMGTMVGHDPSNQIGMAPGARWIGCRNMENGEGTPITYAECYEWFVAPYPLGGDSFTDGDPGRAPHVINNSWSCPPSEGCVAADVLQAVVEVVRAAGIVTVHSAGNSGSSCGTIATPAAIYDASFTVGATNSGDQMAAYSSRGPVLVDGSNRLKPDVVAPGSGVRSSYLGNTYISLSGTSMAAPHVAGLVALLISADPVLSGRVDLIEKLITTSAQPIATNALCGSDMPGIVPNNVFGWGRIDALAALEALEAMPEWYQSLLPSILGWE